LILRLTDQGIKSWYTLHGIRQVATADDCRSSISRVSHEGRQKRKVFVGIEIAITQAAMNSRPGSKKNGTMRRYCCRHGAERIFKQNTVAGKSIQGRGNLSRVAIAAQVIGSQCINRNEQDIRIGLLMSATIEKKESIPQKD